ncbi:MAG TPA: DUF4416 family protein [Candidatus Binatia bacterium]|jgi:hypothetical protein
MGMPGNPKPVKLFAALLSSETDLLAAVGKELAELFGPVDARSETLPWTVSDYYTPEMGSNLLREFVAFAGRVSPETLPEIKLQTQDIERRHRAAGGGRRINIDPGYIDAGKVVLASTKGAGHRIYLRDGIYAEITLLYHSGAFEQFVYTYADYLWPQTTAFLTDARARYLRGL